MKKSSKGFILIGAVAIAIGVTGLSKLTIPMNGNIEKEEAKTYSHNASNILDNVFLSGNDIILPFIFDDADTTITEDKIKSEFAKKGLTVKNISNPEEGDIIGTGTKITVNENSNVYNVIVYGDVDGDGVVDLIDAQNIILHYLEEKKITGFSAEAAKVSDKSDEINLIDAQRVILFYLGSPLEPARLVVDEPGSNNQNPIIKLNGNNPDTVKYGTTYTDPGATVTDVSDKNATLETIGKINTNVLGEQTIVYRATNFSGKETKVERKVNVVDYVKSIEIKAPIKTTYIEGEKIDLTGGEITLVKATGDRNTVISMKDSEVSGVTVSDYDKDGKVTVTYTYTDPVTNKPAKVSTTFNVALNYIESIKIQSTKTKYEVGDAVSEDDIKVFAVRKDGTEEEITGDANLTIDLPKSASLSDKTITATYIDKIGKTHKGTCEINVSLKQVSVINIKTEKMVDGKPQAGTEGDLHSEFKLTLTQNDINEENIPTDKINWVITDNENNNAVVASKENPNTDFELTKTESVNQTNGMLATVMYFKILEEGNYKITITLDGYPETVKGTTDITITESEEVNRIVLDSENKVLSAEDANGVRTLNTREMIPIKFVHIYPDGIEKEDSLILDETRLKISVKSGGSAVSWIACEAMENNTTPATEYIGGIKFTSSKTGIVDVTLTVGNVTQKYKIKIEENAVVPKLKDDGNQTITFYSNAKPGNDLVKPYESGGVIEDGLFVSLIPVVYTDNNKVPASEINSDEPTNTGGAITVKCLDKAGNDCTENLGVKLYDINKNSIVSTASDVGYIGLYYVDDFAKIAGGKIVISYEIPNINDTQEVNIKIIGELTEMQPTVTGKTVENDTIKESLKPYGLFELVLGQNSLEEDIPIDKLQWKLVESENNDEEVATGEGTEQATGTDYIKLVEKPISGSTQTGKAVKMRFKVLQTGNYKLIVTLKDYTVNAELNFNVEEDKKIDGYILDKDNIAIQKVAGTSNEYKMSENIKIPITYMHEYTDEETNEKVLKPISNVNVPVGKLGVKLAYTEAEEWVSYELYYGEDKDGYWISADENEYGINFIELNANKAGKVTLELTLNGKHQTYKINIEETAITEPKLQTVENGQKIESVTFYEDVPPADAPLVTEWVAEGILLSLIPINYTDNSRLNANEVNADEPYNTNGKVTITCVDKYGNDCTGNLSIILCDANKNVIESTALDVGYIGLYYNEDLAGIAGGKVIISCKDTKTGKEIQKIKISIVQ